MKTALFNKAITRIFGKDAVIKTRIIGENTAYVDVLDSSIKPVGEYMVRHVATKKDDGKTYYGFILSSLTFEQIRM